MCVTGNRCNRTKVLKAIDNHEKVISTYPQTEIECGAGVYAYPVERFSYVVTGRQVIELEGQVSERNLFLTEQVAGGIEAEDLTWGLGNEPVRLVILRKSHKLI